MFVPESSDIVFIAQTLKRTLPVMTSSMVAPFASTLFDLVQPRHWDGLYQNQIHWHVLCVEMSFFGGQTGKAIA